jgi:hypothetical protein
MSYKKIQLSLNWKEVKKFFEENPDRIYKAASGKELVSLTLFPNDAPDQYGNDFSVKPRAGKADVENKVRLPFLGNAKIAETSVAQNRQEAGEFGRQKQQRRAAPPPPPDEDVPF